jgi:hypothetical protein
MSDENIRGSLHGRKVSFSQRCENEFQPGDMVGRVPTLITM